MIHTVRIIVLKCSAPLGFSSWRYTEVFSIPAVPSPLPILLCKIIEIKVEEECTQNIKILNCAAS